MQAPPTARRPLKRRHGQAIAAEAPNPALDLTGPEPEPDPVEEPAVKKFKALFEASDPRAAGGLSGGIFSQTQMPASGDLPPTSMDASQTQTQSRATGATQALEIVIEEEEEASYGQSQVDSLGGARGTKRKAADEDVEMGEVVDKSANKRRTLGSRAGSQSVEDRTPTAPTSRTGPTSRIGPLSQASTSRPPDSIQSQSARTKSKEAGKAREAGAAPDTDQRFLEALATKRRGKKGEDLFDKEFNQLKLTKPDLQQQQTHKQQQQQQVEDEWNVMDKLLDEMDLQDPRGNFMLIQEMEVYRRPASVDASANQADSGKWAGPNFKKFRKVTFVAYCWRSLSC